jgi:beta-N-acetylhexosaminidase
MKTHRTAAAVLAATALAVAPPVAALLASAVFSSCAPRGSGLPGAKAAFKDSLAPYRGKAAAIARNMSPEALCGQLVMTGITGRGALSQASRMLLADVPAGALILFGFNVPEEARDLVPELEQAQALALRTGAGIPLFVAIDHEGGEVFRFKRGVTVLPSARVLGEEGPDAVRAAGDVAGRELHALGVSLNLAPVVEARDVRNVEFLKTRAFSADPRVSGELAADFLAAQQARGTAATAKHYPGNGSADPHASEPVVNVTREEIEKKFEPPFRAAVAAGVSTVMLSHARFPALDPDVPASLSPIVIGRLKNTLGFQGIVLTDDLSMKALSGEGGVGEAAVRAVLAGADMVMTSGGQGARLAYNALLSAAKDGRIPKDRLVDAAARILTQKLRFGLKPRVNSGPNT